MNSVLKQFHVLSMISIFMINMLASNAWADSLSLQANQIDKLIINHLDKKNLKPNGPISDEQFMRRVYIDVIGRIPTLEEINNFNADHSTLKRTNLINHLLESDGYNSHMFNWLADMLRVKQTYFRKSVPAATYINWLKKQIRINRPWDQLVKELLTADGTIVENGATGYLLRDAGMLEDSVSNTVTLFLGANIACAQCHDHPTAKWTQREFLEMAAFFGTTDLRVKGSFHIADKLQNNEFSYHMIMAVAQPNFYRIEPFEKWGWLKYPDNYQYHNAKPKQLVKPAFLKWDDENQRMTSVSTASPYTYRRQFSDWMCSKNNPRFATAIANRLWKRIFGYGAHEPINDLDNSELDNNPELLNYITKVMMDVDFDLKKFQAIILNTKAYQQQSSKVPESGESFNFAGPGLRRMTAEQIWDSAVVLIQGSKIDAVVSDHSHLVTRMAFPESLKDFNTRNIIQNQDIIYSLARKAKQNSDAAGVQNKMGFGMVKKLVSESLPQFGVKGMLRASELHQPTNDDHFIRIAGQSTRNVIDDGSLEGGIAEALSMMNGKLSEIITGPESKLSNSILQAKTNPDKVKMIYQAMLCRSPSNRELYIASGALNEGATPQDIIWALLNSREFIYIQ